MLDSLHVQDKFTALINVDTKLTQVNELIQILNFEKEVIETFPDSNFIKVRIIGSDPNDINVYSLERSVENDFNFILTITILDFKKKQLDFSVILTYGKNSILINNKIFKGPKHISKLPEIYDHFFNLNLADYTAYKEMILSH